MWIHCTPITLISFPPPNDAHKNLTKMPLLFSKVNHLIVISRLYFFLHYKGLLLHCNISAVLQIRTYLLVYEIDSNWPALYKMSLFFSMCFQCTVCASGRTRSAVSAARSCTRAPDRAAKTRVSTSRASSHSKWPGWRD